VTAPIRLSVVIAADPQVACDVVRDWQAWPDAFPATIQAVSLLSRTDSTLTLQVLHRIEGPVNNILRPNEDGAVRLREFKPRYDAQFTFFEGPAPAGSRLHVHGCIWLKGWRAWFGCLATPIIRRRMRNYLLEPIRTRAETLTLASSTRGSSTAGARQ
jgi:hypothetical protein